MDPVTHGLTGALLAEAGFAQRFGRQARFAMIGGAIAPDIDVLWSPAGSVVALETHRGITHSFVGGIGVALGVALVARFLGPEKRWGPLIGMSYLGLVLGHLFLDLITPYGIQLFLPFSNARPAWDLAFILDPFQTIPLLVVLLAAWLIPSVRTRVARLGVVYLIAYFTLLAVNHGVALQRVETAAHAQGLSPLKMAALPQPARPFEWLALVETPEVIGRGVVRPWSSGSLTFERIPRGERNGLVHEVERLPSVRTFLWFARFPVVTIRQENGRQVVEYQDLRFSDTPRGRSLFRLRVFVNRRGDVEQVLFGR